MSYDILISNPGMNMLTNIKTEQPITKSEIDHIFYGLLSSKDYLQIYLDKINENMFDPIKEAHCILLLKIIKKIQREGKIDLLYSENLSEAQTFLETEILAYRDLRPKEVPQQVVDELLSKSEDSKGLVPWIFEFKKETSDEKKKDAYFINYIKRFLSIRKIQRGLKHLLEKEGQSFIVNLPEILKTYAEEYVHINKATDNPIKSANISTWTPKPKPRYKTGVNFLDKALNGGQAPGEVYGVLGAYASGKTMLAVQIACQSARVQAEMHRLDKNYIPKRSFIFHYEATHDEMMSRIISHICEISWEELLDFDLNRLSSLDGPIFPKPYEIERWNHAYKSKDGTFQAERERLESRMSLYQDYIHLVDMSGTEDDSKRGAGYIYEIANILNQHVVKNNIPIGCVIIDYAGLCCKRYIAANNMKTESLRHLIGDFGYLCRQLIAVPFSCPVWIFHQLAAASNKKTFNSLQHHADAAEAKNFAENLVFCFNLGVPHPQYRTILMTDTKPRRSVQLKPMFLWVNGQYQVIEEASPYFNLDLVTFEVTPKAKFKEMKYATLNRLMREDENKSNTGLNTDLPYMEFDSE